MLLNLKTKLKEKGISVKALADVVGVSEKTAWNKINGETDFIFQEAMIVANELFPEYKVEYLFAKFEKVGAKNL